jgi:hypothetical protein
MKLSEKAKAITWLIKMRYLKDSIEHSSYAAGFAIKVPEYPNDLVLMTCCHALQETKSKSILDIEVRGHGDEEFLIAERLYSRPTLDITLLIVKGVTREVYGEFAKDGTIANCQTLLQVCHYENFVWSVFIGRAAYQCVNSVESFVNSHPCSEYNSEGYMKTPLYRVMGDIWNAAHFDEFKGPFIYEKNLRSLIPIIQCVGFTCVDAACSGGPVLNTRGEVVGMVVGESDEFQIALHVTTLKKLIECHENEAKGPTKVDEKNKEAKGPTKVDEKSKQPLGGGQGSKVS